MPSVYADASAPPTWERQVSAALLSRPGSIVAGRSAAHLYGFEGFGPGKPTVMTATDANGRLAIGRVIRVSDFDLVAKTHIQGFPITSRAETLWSIARSMTGPKLADIVDQNVAMGLVTGDELVAVLERVTGSRQRGLTNFRNAVEAVDAGAPAVAANRLEVVLYRLLSQPGVPSVSRQHPFLLAHESRVDAFIPSWQLVAEADGRTWHTRQSDFERDRERDNRLASMGILVLRFSFRALTQQFDACLTTLIGTGRHRNAMNTT